MEHAFEVTTVRPRSPSVRRKPGIRKPAEIAFPRVLAWPLLVLVPLVFLIFLAAPPTYASENRTFGDVLVEPGETEDEISAVFGDVTVEGFVVGDVSSALGDVRIDNRVGGDINAGFGDVEVRAPVGGAIEAGFGNVYIDAPVTGDVDVSRGNLRLGSDARISGHVFVGSGEIYGESGYVIEREVVVDPAHGLEDLPRDRGSFGLLVWVFAMALFAACSVLVAVLAPGPLLAAARSAEESPWRSLLLGVASVPAVVVLSVVLGISVVGIPLLLLLAPAYLALVFFGAFVAAFFVGRRVVFAAGRYRGSNALAAVVGALIVTATYPIPVLGGLLLYGLALLGTGAAILTLFSRRRSGPYPSYEAYIREGRHG
jgi:hypothetical protein